MYQAAGDQTINHHHHYPPHPPGAAGEAQRLGHPLAQVDPIALEVHLAIDAGAAAAGLGALPAYVPRTHDEKLATVVGEAQRGRSRIVVLVGGSSTGKTRALWEAVSGLEEPWHLWHPIDPGQPQAALAGLRRVAPHTVIWLNEMQHYLLTGDDIGEQVAAGLRELLHSPKQGPVLVMGTLWPEYAAILSAIPAPGRPDPHAQARKLFNGADMRVPVPESFTGPEVDVAVRLAGTGGDPRWAEAVRQARAGALTQYMAGGPALIERYQNATVAARAVLHAAMDARRLGHGVALSRLLLEEAAAGYLSEDQWDLLADDWLEQAFAYLSAPRPCRGAVPPLTRIRPRPGARPEGEEPSYRLADYLEQHGVRTRRLLCPPAEFWEAAIRQAATPSDHAALASAAFDRGRYRHAFGLWQGSADAGNTIAMQVLPEMHARAGEWVEAERLARAAADAGDTWDVEDLTRAVALARMREGAERLAHASGTGASGDLIGMRSLAGMQEEAERLARADTATSGNIAVLGILARLRDLAGDRKEAEQFARTAADAGNTDAFWRLAWCWRERGVAGRWGDLLRYGLESDGQIADPW
ncbi:hypothetical protein HD597_000385 [Nonomuraea thailandensis]|uniref:Tetratricopeptide repeat protein n=1 Tax=Nonomuraea thailandensis TaxID=1188745 RepID=A0A9X2JZ50_9ACTN|nr:hypothetical protein [Nonomuraea thailandensis]MCP2353365.1 hypothetical protein [Nonomuraea thailandensis]